MVFQPLSDSDSSILATELVVHEPSLTFDRRASKITNDMDSSSSFKHIGILSS